MEEQFMNELPTQVRAEVRHDLRIQKKNPTDKVRKPTRKDKKERREPTEREKSFHGPK